MRRNRKLNPFLLITQRQPMIGAILNKHHKRGQNPERLQPKLPIISPECLLPSTTRRHSKTSRKSNFGSFRPSPSFHEPADGQNVKVHRTKPAEINDQAQTRRGRYVDMFVFRLLTLCATAFAFRSPYPKGRPSVSFGDVGDKLLLTPYIESGDVEKARRLASVPSLLNENVTSYSGYLTVNKTCQSNLFFWFFPTESDRPDAPFAVWLQGGPGASSLYGLFAELGPYELTPDDRLVLRKYSWTRDASYVFFDNPVGTGYSYTEREECYARNQVDVGRDLLNAVKQLLKLFPEYANSPFYVTGESYGGKYVPALAYAIHKDKDPNAKINLQGVALGNGLVDPVNQLTYSDYLYHLSMMDSSEREVMRGQEDRCRGFIERERWKDAFDCFDDLLNGDLQPYPTYFQNVTGFRYYFNFLYANDQPEGNLTAFVTKEKIRRAIHVGNATWHNGTEVEMHLMEDVMKSVRPWVEELLEHYRVLVYNGQLDIIVAYPLTENYLKKLKWSGAAEYKKAKRHVWWVGKDVAGYVKTAGKLTEVAIRNAGHMAPMDQPKWAFDLISRFFKNKPYY